MTEIGMFPSIRKDTKRLLYLHAVLVAAALAGGMPQRFVSGEEISPLWWALFRSEALSRLLTLIPCGLIGEPEDIGRAAAWLASDYVNGTSLYIEGGMMLFPGFSTNG